MINHLFRIESGKMVSVLVKIFGTENYQLAEDVVQDSLLAALNSWKFNGIPEQPRSWLYRVAKNKAIDILRKKKSDIEFNPSDSERILLSSEYTMKTTMDKFWDEDQIRDDFLAMIYASCHPDLSQENQVSFVLKSLCGFSTKEIARSFLSPEDTISKRIYRTKEFFRENKIKPQIPRGNEISERTHSVLNCIYLLFNEGYNSTHHESLIRSELIAQAMYLCRSVIEHPRSRSAEAYALMALMCFHASRTEARINTEGEIISLKDQNRSVWNSELISAGNDYLNKASGVSAMSPFHLEAAIAYEHCVARTYKDTNWKHIAGFYEQLLDLGRDPVIFLNYCIAIRELKDSATAIDLLESIKGDLKIRKYHLYHAFKGELLSDLGRTKESRISFEKAKQLSQSAREKNLLDRKMGFSH